MVSNELVDQLSIQYISKYLESCKVSSHAHAEKALVQLISIAVKALSDNTSVATTLLNLATIENALVEYTRPVQVIPIPQLQHADQQSITTH